MNAMDDRGIVALYLRRDETAIRQTAEKYGSRLRTLAYGTLRPRWRNMALPGSPAIRDSASSCATAMGTPCGWGPTSTP